MNVQKIRMTKEGYDEQIEILNELKRRFQENERLMTSAFKNSSGDGAHDNAEFEELLSIERTLVAQINMQTTKIQNIEIIEVETLDKDVVNIGDTVKLHMIFSADDIDEMQLTLVGAEGKPQEDKISINSPLGKAIFMHKEGELVTYTVNNEPISVKIIKKVKNCK